VIMKIDLAGPQRRGLAMGLNEAAGYVAVAVTAYLTGLIAARAGLRPEPFVLGLAYAGLGLGLSALPVRETRGHVDLEAQLTDANPSPDRPPDPAGGERLSTRQVLVRTSLREPALSDRRGGKPLITSGMLLQAVALAGTALSGSLLPWAACAILLGAGTAMVYPTLLAAVGDVAHPTWRATAVGVYRLCVTPASPPAPCSPGWSPTSPASGPRCGSSPPSPPPPA